MDLDKLQDPKDKKNIFRRQDPRRSRRWFVVDYFKISGVFFCALIILLQIKFFTPSLLGQAENYFLDVFFKLRPSVSQSAQLVYIDVKQEDLIALGKWPWDRKYYAMLVRALKDWGAKGIVFNIPLDKPQSEEGDASLEQALLEAKDGGMQVYLPVVTDNNSRALVPLPRFANNAYTQVYSDVIVDQDKVARKFKPFILVDGQSHIQVGLKAGLDVMGGAPKKVEYISSKYQPWFTPDGNIIINWSDAESKKDQVFSFADIIKSHISFKNNLTPIIDPKNMMGKLCFVGLAINEDTTSVTTPLSVNAPISYVNGDIANSFLNNQLIKTIDKDSRDLILFAVGLIALAIFFPYRNPSSIFISFILIAGVTYLAHHYQLINYAWAYGFAALVVVVFIFQYYLVWSLLMCLFLAAAWGLVSFVGLWHENYWLYVFQPVLLIVLLYLYNQVFNYYVIKRERTHYFKLATKDSLTGLYTIGHFRYLLNKAADNNPQNNIGVALFLIDMDNFKGINDTYGHKGGDDALKRLAEIVRSLEQSKELLDQGLHCTGGRYGGDEFLLMVKGASEPGDLRKIADKLVHEAKTSLITAGEKSFNLSLSIGVGFLHKGETVPDLMVKRADEALYRSKERGKGRATLETE